jgi:hypothetical protein
MGEIFTDPLSLSSFIFALYLVIVHPTKLQGLLKLAFSARLKAALSVSRDVELTLSGQAFLSAA